MDSLEKLFAPGLTYETRSEVYIKLTGEAPTENKSTSDARLANILEFAAIDKLEIKCSNASPEEIKDIIRIMCFSSHDDIRKRAYEVLYDPADKRRQLIEKSGICDHDIIAKIGKFDAKQFLDSDRSIYPAKVTSDFKYGNYGFTINIESVEKEIPRKTILAIIGQIRQKFGNVDKADLDFLFVCMGVKDKYLAVYAMTTMQRIALIAEQNEFVTVKKQEETIVESQSVASTPSASRGWCIIS